MMDTYEHASSPLLSRFCPCGHPLVGTISVPGDKSISHRVVLFASMAEGTSQVSGILNSEDVISSIRVCEKLGAQIDLTQQEDGSLAGSITGWGKSGPRQPEEDLDCGNSGTTARLLMGILGGSDITATLTGDESLKRRPMRRISAPLMKMGVHFDPPEAQELPFTVMGKSTLTALDYQAPMASAQLKTAVLLAGLSAEGITSVREPYPSGNNSELLLPRFGAETTAASCNASVQGPKTLEPCTIHIPGDPSLAAYALCAAAVIPGSEVTVKGVSLNHSRLGFMRVLERMGAEVRIASEGYEGKEPYGTLTVRYCPRMHGCVVEASEVPTIIDEIPVLSVVASLSHGITVFRDVQDLHSKGGDRLQSIVEALSDLGADVYSKGTDLYIEGERGFQMNKDVVLASSDDPRLAMAWAFAGLVGDTPVSVESFACSDAFYPQFVNDFERLQA